MTNHDCPYCGCTQVGKPHCNQPWSDLHWFDLRRLIELTKPLDLAWFGPFGMGTESPADAYLITGGGSTKVNHQYGCIGCRQYEETEKNVYPIYGKFGTNLESASRCSPNIEILLEMFGKDFHSVDEGLIRLSYGDILTWNCD